MGTQGLILRVDLSKGTVSRQPVPEEWRRKYIGGEGINTWLLWEHFLKVDPRIDPCSKDNVLIVGSGPLCGTGFPAGSKMKFTFKSPAYNMYGDTSSAGTLGSQLRWAGYDHLVITGRAKSPAYLWIKDDHVEIRDASHLWGQDMHAADAAIRRELGEPRLETAGIGQAGENLVRMACVVVSRHRAGGRGGAGCVFGSKNLKAIAAHGTRGLSVHDPGAFFQAMDGFLSARTMRSQEHDMRYGSLSHLRRNQALGFNAYRNHQATLMPEDGLASLDHIWYTKNMGVRAYACSPGCAYACGHWHYVKGDESPAAPGLAGEWATMPEYGSANPFGMGCDIRDLPAVAHLTHLCNQYGMDTMEAGMSIALLMELWERGIITEADTTEWAGEPLPLDWGNHSSVEKVLRTMATQSNPLGEILKGGVYQAALTIGQLKGTDVLRYAVYGKGGATHECQGSRVWPALALACAVAPIGAHHLKGLQISPGASTMFLGKPDAGETTFAGKSFEGDVQGSSLKGAGHAISESLNAVANSLGICQRLFSRDPDVVSLDLMAAALEAVTGVTLSGEDLLLAGERIANIQKAFNSRLGYGRADDTLCYRWLNEPQREGLTKGIKAGDFLEGLKDEYYGWRGWDRGTSLQTRRKLEELDMFEVAQVLEKENALIC